MVDEMKIKYLLKFKTLVHDFKCIWTLKPFFNNKVIIPKVTLNWSTDSVLDLNYKYQYTLSVHVFKPSLS